MNDQSLKIIFMGTPDFAASALKALHEDSPHEVIALYSQPPRPKGRGQKMQLSETHSYADKNNIPVYTPKSLKKEQQQKEFAELGADIAVVAAYGLILPQAVLDAPRYGCLNIHASLLPRWRGASPIQRAIWAGDEETGVTIMQMDRGLDTGAMIKKAAMPLNAQITSQQLHDALAQMGATLICEVLGEPATKGEIESKPQPDEGVTYAHLLKKTDGQIDWLDSAAEIDRQIRALNPWPGTYIGGLKIKQAELTDQITDQPAGTILDKKGLIACGGGTVLKIKILQPAGKKAMDFASALNGGYVSVGDTLLAKDIS